MTDVPMPIIGRCLCGEVTYRVEAQPLWQGVCHCSNCQHQTAAPFSVVVGVPTDALSVEGSTLASFKTVSEGYASTTERRFCSACGSPLFSTIEAMPAVAFLKAGTIDDVAWFEPTVEIWTSSAQPWSPHFEGLPQYARLPE
ncbi:MAG: GFA family protein [Solirubrobacteraceae bacterium]